MFNAQTGEARSGSMMKLMKCLWVNEARVPRSTKPNSISFDQLVSVGSQFGGSFAQRVFSSFLVGRRHRVTKVIIEEKKLKTSLSRASFAKSNYFLMEKNFVGELKSFRYLADSCSCWCSWLCVACFDSPTPRRVEKQTKKTFFIYLSPFFLLLRARGEFRYFKIQK